MKTLYEIFVAARENCEMHDVKFTTQYVTEYAVEVFDVRLTPEHAKQLVAAHERAAEIAHGVNEFQRALYFDIEQPLSEICLGEEPKE